MSENFEAQKIQLIHDLKTVIHDAQLLIQSKSHDCKVNSEELKKSMAQKLSDAIEQLHHIEFHTNEKINHAAQKTKAYVLYHPIKALGISAGVGLLIGILMKRR